MCGIVGLISKKPGGFFANDLDMFQAMLVNDTQRGEDSTGSFIVKRNGDAESIKIASHPFNLFATSGWDKFRQTAINQSKVIVGHNRKATLGAINSANAHPFQEGPIVLVHNGTLRNHKEWKLDRDVDSHALCQLIAEKGHEEALKMVDGAFALVWYNLETGKLYMCRNKERPLSIVATDEMIAFASEAWMPWGQFHRAGDAKKINQNFVLDEGVLYEFDPNKGGDYTTKKLELFTPKVYDFTGSGNGRWSNYYGSNGGVYNGRDWDREWEEALVQEAQAANDGKTQDDILEKARDIVTPFAKVEVAAGEVVQIKLNRIHLEKNAMAGGIEMPKVYGKVIEFGKPELDCVGWLPANTKNTEWKDYLETLLTASIVSINGSASGPSCWVDKIDFDDMVETFNGVKIGGHTWDNHIAGHKCSKCDNHINPQDGVFTSVNLKKDEARVHCFTCVSDSLKGEMRNAFIQRRIAAVQARQSVSKYTEQQSQSAIQLAGPSTVQ